ncbi:MAG: hypothetical protein KDA78_21705, partial [Planctomycetaceae bacterium]|nr:hypothetical protein [Planctomycetaceae bacterium]
SALEIGLELERLAQAVDNQDLVGLKAMANHLAANAQKNGVPEIAAKAMELETAVNQNSDLLGILRSASELLDFCRASQLAVLEPEESAST